MAEQILLCPEASPSALICWYSNKALNCNNYTSFLQSQYSCTLETRGPSWWKGRTGAIEGTIVGAETGAIEGVRIRTEAIEGANMVAGTGAIERVIVGAGTGAMEGTIVTSLRQPV